MATVSDEQCKDRWQLLIGCSDLVAGIGSVKASVVPVIRYSLSPLLRTARTQHAAELVAVLQSNDAA